MLRFACIHNTELLTNPTPSLRRVSRWPMARCAVVSVFRNMVWGWNIFPVAPYPFTAPFTHPFPYSGEEIQHASGRTYRKNYRPDTQACVLRCRNDQFTVA